MLRLRRAFVLSACAGILFCSLGAAAEATKRTEVFRIDRVDAQQALLAIRSLSGAREIEVVETHSLSIHDGEEKLLLARKIVQMLARTEETPATYEVGDGTTIGSVALRHTSAHEASRMLMSQIAIRNVATVQELALVLIRDSPEQVEKALELLRVFDKAH